MKRDLKHLKKKPGLTLIEVIISVALLAILSIPIFVTVNTNVKLSQKTEMSQQATVIGQRVLEYLSSINQLTLNDSGILQPVGLQLLFTKDLNSNLVKAQGKTKQNFDIEIELKHLIENNHVESSNSTTNDLMKNPQFKISQMQNREFSVNDRTISGINQLKIDEANNVSLCNGEGVCIQTTYENEIVIQIDGSISNEQKVLVINEDRDSLKKVYIQYEANQTKNLKFEKESGEVSISYLTKSPDILVGDDEMAVETIEDLYEIKVNITSSKIDQLLFKGSTVTNFNIYELGQEGE